MLIIISLGKDKFFKIDSFEFIILVEVLWLLLLYFGGQYFIQNMHWNA